MIELKTCDLVELMDDLTAEKDACDTRKRLREKYEGIGGGQYPIWSELVAAEIADRMIEQRRGKQC